ncbi:RAI1-domain-containing protein [Lizonia empirigonia]|nr:RAI1-domain-containing protein [Lizonia empirigonia]
MAEQFANTTSSTLPSNHTDPSPDDGDRSPPRKRPRTKALPQMAATNTEVGESIPQLAPHAAPPAPPTPTPTSSSEVRRFLIQPLCRFQGASASIKRPREVAHFSYDDNHEYRDDESSINYYMPPPMGADLKEGFDTFRHYEDKEDPHLDSLLRALIHTERERIDGQRPPEIQGKEIMTAPYDNFAEFSMFATLHDGTIYIEEDFPSRSASRAAESSRPPSRYRHPDQQSQAMMAYWGYKFETLSLTPTPPSTIPPDQIRAHQQSVTSNHAQHCSIVHTSFGGHSLLLGGEVDGLLSPKPRDADTPIPWVELKTAEELPPPARQQHRDVLRFERKLLKFWAQSFLLGVPKIVVGFRSKSGILRGVQMFNTHELPGMEQKTESSA